MWHLCPRYSFRTLLERFGIFDTNTLFVVLFWRNILDYSVPLPKGRLQLRAVLTQIIRRCTLLLLTAFQNIRMFLIKLAIISWVSIHPFVFVYYRNLQKEQPLKMHYISQHSNQYSLTAQNTISLYRSFQQSFIKHVGKILPGNISELNWTSSSAL